jgi:hypothetical protein
MPLDALDVGIAGWPCQRARLCYVALIVDCYDQRIGIVNHSRAITLIKAMLSKQTLIARVTPRSSGAKEMAFNIGGLDQFIEPLRKACKW